jgi:hypothetical protein
MTLVSWTSSRISTDVQVQSRKDVSTCKRPARDGTKVHQQHRTPHQYSSHLRVERKQC